MKIFAVLGSPRGDASVGNKVLELIKGNLSKYEENIEMTIYRLNELNIKEADGSGNDFFTGHTLYNDDMELLELEMINSDVILFVSPVYVHSVSSYMKRFIDRISYWTHLFRLVGKKGFVISVSSDNGNKQVNDYLREVMEYLGINVLGEASIECAKILNNKNVLESYARFISTKIINSNTDELEFSISQKINYQVYRKKYMESKDCVEKEYWKTNHYFDYEDFEELFRSKLLEKNK